MTMAQTVVHFYNNDTEARLTKREPVDPNATTKTRADRVRTDIFRVSDRGKIAKTTTRGDHRVAQEWTLKGDVLSWRGQVIVARKDGKRYRLVQMHRAEHEGADFVQPHIAARQTAKSEGAQKLSDDDKEPETAPKTEDPPTTEAGPTASPAARKLAAEVGVDLTAVQGTGADGNITKGDVEKYLEAQTKSE